jgi:hypothetical protein
MGRTRKAGISPEEKNRLVKERAGMIGYTLAIVNARTSLYPIFFCPIALYT